VANFAIDLGRTASTVASLGTVTADATRPKRMKFYDAIIGAQGTVGDNPFLYTFQRCTAAGTSTAVVPQPLDPADAATEQDAGENHTIEPTYTAAAILLNIALNQRATFRWVAAPGSELVTPATAANGVGVQTPTSSAVAIQTQLLVQEQ
jgi:hypothetical protein